MLRKAGGYAGLKRQRRRRYLKAALYGLAAGCVGALAGALLSLLCR